MCPRHRIPVPATNRDGAGTRVNVLPSGPAKHYHRRKHAMQMKNMKRDINCESVGDRRRSPTTVRNYLGNAVGGAPRRRRFALRRPGLAAVAALMLLPPCRLEFGADW
jgi:hypothetical protein